MSAVRSHLQPIRLCLRCSYTTAAAANTTPSATPLLLKLRSDLKTAMKTKDTNRLNVLRSLLAEITNASKTSSPITTDLQLLSLLRKRAAMSRTAAQEFGAAKRTDLKDKEEAQVAVLEEYAGEVDTIGEEEITRVVGEVIGRMVSDEKKLDLGSVLKNLLGPGGAFNGKPVEKAEVAKIVASLMADLIRKHTAQRSSEV
ncbi:Uncharacterised domain YOR215C, mitochondrial [Lasallia pustulata]|uniref:Altered inheritance of mitochondria protein 41 n=1 Tax=Lasallia pustulata TaxID=136370 RepID=A0A1W5CSA2_9LECA|nr:Uncharacterised domain YOR215C, mitochondrial [Lasallia pustulata]